MATARKDLQAAGPTSIVVAIEPGTPFTVDELLDLVDKALVVDPADLGSGVPATT